MRRPLIAGNWKMYKTATEAVPLLDALTKAEEGKSELLVCPPFTALPETQRILSSSFVNWGAQNMYCEKEGAFTGEISPFMLKDLGCSYVICGHSERRHIFGEKDDLIHRKVETAFWYDMIPILCAGETEAERKQGLTKAVLSRQVRTALTGLIEEEASRMVIAYEPVWAIGSGAAATADDAEEACRFIRREVHDLLGHDAAENIRILYGGSVKKENILSFLEKEDIDGALIGGASLKAEEFLAIYEKAESLLQ